MSQTKPKELADLWRVVCDDTPAPGGDNTSSPSKNLLSRNELYTQILLEQYQLIDVAGDGNCFFRAIVKHFVPNSLQQFENALSMALREAINDESIDPPTAQVGLTEDVAPVKVETIITNLEPTLSPLPSDSQNEDGPDLSPKDNKRGVESGGTEDCKEEGVQHVKRAKSDQKFSGFIIDSVNDSKVRLTTTLIYAINTEHILRQCETLESGQITFKS